MLKLSALRTGGGTFFSCTYPLGPPRWPNQSNSSFCFPFKDFDPDKTLVTCLLFNCYSALCMFLLLNMDTTCILPLLQHASCLNMCHMIITFMLQACSAKHVSVSNMHVTCTRFHIGDQPFYTSLQVFSVQDRSLQLDSLTLDLFNRRPDLPTNQASSFCAVIA